MTGGRPTPDRCAVELARRQDDVLSAADLQHVGLDRFAVRRRVAKGTLHRLHLGAFSLTPSPTVRGRNRAALITCGEAAWLAARSACAVWGFTDEWEGPVDLLLHQRELSREGLNVRTTGWLPDHHRAVRDGLRVTSPARSLLDLGRHVAPGRHEHAVAAALRSRWVTEAELHELAATGRAGARALAAHLDRLGGAQFSRSEAERIVLGLIRDARLPPPVANERVHGAERDLVWPEARVIAEFDGFAFHWSPSAKRDDNRRDGDLALRGWRTVRLTWQEITEEPLVVVARLAAAVAIGHTGAQWPTGNTPPARSPTASWAVSPTS